jgi:hypothetical protein
VKKLVGDRDVTALILANQRDVREIDTGPDSFATKLLDELGIEAGGGGADSVQIRAGQEWLGRGGLAGARDALADVARAL